jgi:hypothetical protein
MPRTVSVEFVGIDTYLQARDPNACDRSEFITGKVLDNFKIRDVQSDLDTNHLLALGRHVVWMLCDTKIIPIKGRSTPACFEIMIQAHPVTEWHTRPEPASPIDNLRQIESPKESNLRAIAQQGLGNIVGDAVPGALAGELHFACLFAAASVNFPCGGSNVEIPMIDGTWKVCLLISLIYTLVRIRSTDNIADIQ